jgi:MFS transporter, FHS family, glucose/mannose:H+ symporter
MSASASLPKTIPISTNGTVLIHVDFLLTGIVMTFLGAMLPILAARWSITDSVSGRLYLTQFVSSMFGMLASAPVVQRRGYRFTFIIGLVLMAAGMALLASGPFWRGIIAVAILGFGHGITTPAGNLRTANVNPHHSASALNVINAVWGLGAMSAPILVKIAAEARHPAWFLYGTAVALTILLAAFLIASFVPDAHSESRNPVSRGLRMSWMVPVICALFFIYVGAENSFGGWVATYAHRMGTGRGTFWMAPAFFYGAMLTGRALAPLALSTLRETTMAKVGLTLALLGGVALLIAHGIGLIVVGSSLAGLGLASVFPISVSLFPSWFGESAHTASGPIFACGNLGGAMLPWVVGVVSTHSGSLRLALLVPLLGVITMLVFYLTNRVPIRHVLTVSGPIPESRP